MRRHRTVRQVLDDVVLVYESSAHADHIGSRSGGFECARAMGRAALRNRRLPGRFVAPESKAADRTSVRSAAPLDVRTPDQKRRFTPTRAMLSVMRPVVIVVVGLRAMLGSLPRSMNRYSSL